MLDFEKNQIIHFNPKRNAFLIETGQLSFFFQKLNQISFQDTLLNQIKNQFINHFSKQNERYFYFPIEIISSENSTVKNLKKKDNLTKTSGDYPQISSQNHVLKVRDEDIEIIQNTPLVDIADKIQECIREEELFIDPNTIIHAIRISYKFGVDSKDQYRKQKSKTDDQIERENIIYDKIIKGLGVDFHKRGRSGKDANGWDWPVIYINREKKRKAHFSIRMHEKGRFIIPLKRDFNLGEFFEEFDKVFSFLSIDDLLDLYSILELRDGKGKISPFVHLANKLEPDDLAKIKLNTAKVKIRWLRYLNTFETRAKVDASRGIELELEGNNPQTELLSKVMANAIIVTDTLLDMSKKTDKIEESTGRLNVGQNIIYQEIVRGIAATHSIAMINPHIITSALSSSMKPYINTLNVFKSSFNTSINILGDMNSGINALNKNINYISEEVVQIGNGVSTSIETLTDTIETENEGLKNDIYNKIEEGNIDVISGVNSLVNTKYHEHQRKLENIEKKLDSIDKKLDDNFEILSKSLTQKIHNLKDHFKTTLYLLLRNESNNHHITISELKEKANIPRTTLLYHLKKLQEKGYIEVNSRKIGKRGRPPKLYKIHKKIKDLIKKK